MTLTPHERGRRELSQEAQIQQFIKALGQAMVLNHWSQRALCDQIDCKIGTLTKYLRGAVAPLKVGTGIQANLARVLGVTLDALVDYYRYGEYTMNVSVREVESWIRSAAAQDDLPVLMDSLQAAGERWLTAGPVEEVSVAVIKPEPYTWPLEAVREARLSDAMRQRMGITDEDLAPLVERGEFDEELAEAFAVACGFETEDVLKAFAERQVLH